jgi:hypothetical protein
MSRLKPVTGLWKIQPKWVVTPEKPTTATNIQDLNDNRPLLNDTKNFNV